PRRQPRCRRTRRAAPGPPLGPARCRPPGRPGSSMHSPPLCAARRPRHPHRYDSAVAIRVVFAEDNYLVREGTSALLRESEDIELVAAVEDMPSLLAAVDREKPDAVLTDIRMPPTSTTEGIDAAREIRGKHPDVGVVVLSQYADEEYAYELLKEGAAGLGYLLKERVA